MDRSSLIQEQVQEGERKAGAQAEVVVVVATLTTVGRREFLCVGHRWFDRRDLSRPRVGEASRLGVRDGGGDGGGPCGHLRLDILGSILPDDHGLRARHPPFHLHFTPTRGSWLNLVERWFAEVTRRQIKRGAHRSTKELEIAIRSYLKIYNLDPKPFIRTKSADEILKSVAAYAQRISDSGD